MGGDVIARPTVQKSQPEEISPDEPPTRTCSHFDDARHARFILVLPHKFVAKMRELAQVHINRFAAEMVQVAAQLADRSVNTEDCVRIDTTPPRFAPAPQPDRPVRVPVAVPDPAPAIPGKPWKTECRTTSGCRGVGNGFKDLVSQLWRNCFVRVQIKQPLARSFIRSGVLLSDIPFPRLAIDTRRVSARFPRYRPVLPHSGRRSARGSSPVRWRAPGRYGRLRLRK